MFKKITLKLFFLCFFFTLNGQITLNPISQNTLSIWSADQIYFYEFYLENKGDDRACEISINSIKENTSVQIGIGNDLTESNKLTKTICDQEKILIRVFFKNLPNHSKEDSLLIKITYDTIIVQSSFNYKLVNEEDQKVKIFQTDFNKYLIMDIDYGSVKEVILYSEDRSKFEHIRSRARIIDLSFLEIGRYIIEINNEEYIINKM